MTLTYPFAVSGAPWRTQNYQIYISIDNAFRLTMQLDFSWIHYTKAYEIKGNILDKNT